jgi:hypothetical protein
MTATHRSRSFYMPKKTFLVLLLMICSRVHGMPFHWLPVQSMPENVRSVHSDHIDGNVFFTVTNNGLIMRTMDSCDTWEHITIAEQRYVHDLWTDFSERHAWYASTQINNDYELWFSSDNGDSWQLRFVSGDEIRYLSPAPLAQGILLGAFQQPGSDRIMLQKSETAGSDWYTVFETGDPGMAPVWHFSSVWQAHWGRYVSFDTGETWVEQAAKPVTACGVDIPPSLLAPTSEGLFRSRDNLLTWWPLLVETVNFVSVNPLNDAQLITGLKDTPDQPVLYYTADSGKTFSTWTHGLPAPVSDLCIAADWLFLAVSNDRLYKYDERPADINGSNRVDGADLIILATAFGRHADDPGYIEHADLNRDGVIDGVDIGILSAVFGHRFFYDDTKDPGDFLE